MCVYSEKKRGGERKKRQWGLKIIRRSYLSPGVFANVNNFQTMLALKYRDTF